MKWHSGFNDGFQPQDGLNFSTHIFIEAHFREGRYEPPSITTRKLHVPNKNKRSIHSLCTVPQHLLNSLPWRSVPSPYSLPVPARSAASIKAGVAFNYVPATNIPSRPPFFSPKAEPSVLIGSRPAPRYWTWHWEEVYAGLYSQVSRAGLGEK